MQTKQKKWWQHSLAMMLSLVLVLSSFLAGGMPVSYAAEGETSSWVKPVLWLKADDGPTVDNGKFTGWEDKSVEPVQFTLDVPSGQEARTPKYNANGVNFNPSVTFSNPTNSNHYGTSAKLVGDKQITFQSGYAVYKPNGGALVGSVEIQHYGAIIMGSYGSNFAVGNGASSTYRYIPGASNVRYQLVQYEIKDKIEHTGKIDGKPVTLARGNQFEPITITPVVGATAGTSSENWGGLNGEVAEIILFNEMTTSDAAKIETYLAVKYGITLNDGNSDYVAASEATVWDAAKNSGYKKNIAGIGLDTIEGLHQKQSRSINTGTQIVISSGQLTETNEVDSSELTDGQYLIWGDNGAELKFTQPVGNLNMNHTERIWKVQNTGSVDEVNIAIPKASVPTGTKLLVGTSETDFTTATPHPMIEVTVGGTDYYVTKATLANGQYFTFAAALPVPQSVTVEEITANQNQIAVTFDKDIKLTAPEATGFTVTVGTETITLTDADVKVDPVNPKRLLITLPAGTDTTGKLVKVEYDGQGNLTGTNNVPVNKFEKDVINVDKTALQNKVEEVKMLEESNYTPDSWVELQEVLKEAERVLKDPDATQKQVEAALEKLKQAEQELVLVKPVPTTAVLEQTKGGNKIAVDFNQTITLTNLTGFTIHIEGVEVTPTGFEVIGDKLVLTFPNNPDATDKAVKVKYDGTGNLQGTNGAAIEQFELPVEDPYSAAFQITKPDAVTANPQPTIGGKVDVTTTPSTVTIVLKNDKDEPLLVDVVAIVDPVTGEWTFTPPTDLPDGTYTIIATATNGQQTVTKKHTFTVATTPIVNKVPLQQKVEEGKNLVASEYTPASWSNYQTALNKAKEILANPNATQEEVDKALAALTGAQNALVKIGKGLGTLTPSTGTLSPSFQTGVTDYTMTVGYSTSVIDFTAIPVEAGATVTTTVNGQLGAIGQIPLQVGENIIVISVKDANGNVRQYTIKVYRDAYTGGGGSWTPNPTPPVTPTPGDTKTKIRVELEVDGEKPLAKTTVEIERTKHANGDITDFVALTEANAKEAVAKAKEIGNNIARIVLPDVNDEVKEAKVEIPKESLKLLRDNGLSLEISSENGHIAIPVSSMEGIDDNFYFRLVPVKKESERQAIEERARAERVVRATLQSNDVHVVARPMTIETNMPNRPVQVTLPLKGVKIPTDATEREAFLKQLAVFIEHSDGEKKVVIPEVVTMAKGEQGLRFTVEKFSTFTIIQVNKKEETKPPLEVKEHEAYIKGFQDGTFGPEKNVTRAQVATMIARILGYTDGPVNTAPFKDIPSDHYAAGAIAFVKERGIMNGDVNGNFRASENITRAQMATVVANFKQLSIEENVAITFNDTKDHWAQWIIEANRAAGIINGRQDGSFAPDEHLTRAQAVIMMNRMFERGPLQGITAPSFPDVKATHWAFDDIEEAAKSHAYFIDEDGDEQLSK
ncbi:S-layer homology domain-containing protein [Lysinibacillus pakistanensis]|uniref:S-layer homology domain-containing protein n=1 Tax=Lysinibacillus pakistanensis TaxID=759811 RepID=UPI003D27C179